MKFLSTYLFVFGVSSHIVVVLLLLWQPILISKITTKFSNKYYELQKQRDYEKLTQGKTRTIREEINTTFVPWKAQSHENFNPTLTYVNEQVYSNLTSAVKSLHDGDTLLIAAGTYRKPIVITKNHITIKGNGHVIFEKNAAHNKGFILNQGNNLTVENIECRHISVRDGNGACIRQEGVDLTLNHVYFHDSQEGVLETANVKGKITINDSRFELLGFNGQAHGIYTNKADLYVYQSLFIAAKDQGHAIKVRGSKLYISESIIASLSSDDSRLIDMSSGGELVVLNSILEQGPKSVNGQMIGYALEGFQHDYNKIELKNNLIYLDRIGENELLATPSGSKNGLSIVRNQNTVIGKEQKTEQNDDISFLSRGDMGLPQYPFFSTAFCQRMSNCSLQLENF